MPGDSHVFFPSIGGLGSRNQMRAFDSHSKASGDFTERRMIGGQVTFLTPAGAAAYDQFKAAGDELVEPRVEKDPSGLQKLWKTTRTQTHEGRT